MPRANSVASLAPGSVGLSQICWPGGTAVLFAIGVVPDASENMSAPVALTVTVVPASALMVNGPSGLSAGPRSVAGVIVRLGGGGCTSGPLLITSATMASTSGRAGSVVVRTYLSVKNQIADCTAAARRLSFAAAGRLVVG